MFSPHRLDGGDSFGTILGDPAGNLAHLEVIDRQASLRDVLAHDGSPAGINAVSDIDRGNEHVIRARSAMRPNVGVMLMYPIVVCKDGGGADIGAFPDGGVPHIRQVRNLGASPDLNVFRFAKSSDFRTFRQDGSRT